MLSPRRKGRCGRSPPAPEKSQRSPAAREPGGPAMEEGSGFRLSAECLDEPPNSRVFVVLGKDTGEALIRERFAPFGDIQNIWLLRDKRTNESRGIAFIKFARSSQACRAMEEMHGRSLVPDTKPIKVPPPGRAARFLPGSGARGERAGPGGVVPGRLPSAAAAESGRPRSLRPELAAWEGRVGLRGGNGEPAPQRGAGGGGGRWRRPAWSSPGGPPASWPPRRAAGSEPPRRASGPLLAAFSPHVVPVLMLSPLLVSPGAVSAAGLVGSAVLFRGSCSGSHPCPKCPRVA